MADVRILIADDHSLFREGLKGLLEDQPGFRVVGEALDGREALEMTGRLKPDILLLDLQMPVLHGMEVLKLLGASAKQTRIIVLAAVVEKDQLSQTFRLGARGVILKESATTSLFSCISAVRANQYWVLREAISDLSQMRDSAAYFGETKGRPKDYGLTSREMEVVTAIVAGKTNREIAGAFSISEQTVKHHVTNVFDKVGVYNRLELALFAIHHGLVGRPGRP